MSNLVNRVTASCAVVTMAVSGAALATQPAAAQEKTVLTATPATRAPSCVHVVRGGNAFWTTLHIKNTCSYPVTLKVVIHLGFDSRCKTINPGKTYLFGFFADTYDHLENCRVIS